MKKIEYKATALQALHTGSDENSGTVSKFRREKVKLLKPVVLESLFNCEEDRRNAVVEIYDAVWRKIDFEGMSSGRRMKIWDEFSGKVSAAAHSRTKAEFLNMLAASFDIKAIKNIRVLELLNKFSDDEFLMLVREEHQLLILMLRKYREDSKVPHEFEEQLEDSGGFYGFENGEKEAGKKQDPLPAVINPPEKLIFRKTSEWIPAISGNSIRGILRRLAMLDFCTRAGIEALDKKDYHMLFTGGMLDGSTRFEEIEEKEKLVEMCPMAGLFGCASGNQMIAGQLMVGALRPICIEHGNGASSFYEMLSMEFGVRLDSSKVEKNLDIISIEDEKKKKVATQQMKYGFEVLIKGAELTGEFGCTSLNPLMLSAFDHLLDLFKKNPYVGGISGIGFGKLDLDYEIKPAQTSLYRDYLKDNRKDIQEYFKTK